MSYLLGKQGTQVITPTKSRALSRRTRPRWAELLWWEKKPDCGAQRWYEAKVATGTKVVGTMVGHRQAVYTIECSYQLFVAVFLYFYLI